MNLPTNVTKFTKFEPITEQIDKLFENKDLFNDLLQFVLGVKFPLPPVRKNQLVLNYKTLEVKQEPERTTDDEKQVSGTSSKNYMNKYSSDYLTYHMNSIVSEESEMRLTTYDLSVLDNYFESLVGKRYGFLPLSVHARDSPNANQHYLLVILDYKTDRFHLFDSRNSNDYLYRSKDLPKDALESLMIGLTQFKPFSAPFQYVPMAEWLGDQLQTVVHRNKWDSIYSLAWCLLIAATLDGSEEMTPESLMIEFNNTGIELDKQNFIHNFAQSVLLNYRDFLGGSKIIKEYELTGHLSSRDALRRHLYSKSMWDHLSVAEKEKMIEDNSTMGVLESKLNDKSAPSASPEKSSSDNESDDVDESAASSSSSSPADNSPRSTPAGKCIIS